MDNLGLPNNEPIPLLLKRVLHYVEPWEEMWPYYRVRFFAIRHGSKWRLILGCWAARLTEWRHPDDREELSPSRKGFYVSGLYPRDWVIPLLHEAATCGTFTWLLRNKEQICIEVSPHVGLRAYMSPFSQGKPHSTLLESDGEQVPWRIASMEAGAPWCAASSASRWESAKQEVADDYAESSFSSLLNNLWGHNIGSRADCCIAVDFPLGLDLRRVETSADRKTSRWNVFAWQPLTLQSLTIRPARDRVYSQSVSPLQMTAEASRSPNPIAVMDVPRSIARLFVEVTPPSSANGLTSPLRLSYDVVEPPEIEQLRIAIASLYQQGEQTWREHLLTGTGEPFELAVANLLGVFGYSVAFGGAVNGVQTPGVDLLAISRRSPEALLVSCKGGSNKSGGQSVANFPHWKNVAKAIRTYQSMLPNWNLRVVVATHLTEDEIRAQRPPDNLGVPITIWGEQQLKQLFAASSYDDLASLLRTQDF